MDESLFVRLDNENNTVTLISQYRMNSRIMSIANSLTYSGQLKEGNETVANATLNVQDASVRYKSYNTPISYYCNMH